MFKQWMFGVLATGVFASSPSGAADDSGFYVGLGAFDAVNRLQDARTGARTTKPASRDGTAC